MPFDSLVRTSGQAPVAVPVPHTVLIEARCANPDCNKRIKATYDVEKRGLFAWHHADGGREQCAS